jgi:hypothetical protein
LKAAGTTGNSGRKHGSDDAVHVPEDGTRRPTLLIRGERFDLWNDGAPNGARHWTICVY